MTFNINIKPYCFILMDVTGERIQGSLDWESSLYHVTSVERMDHGKGFAIYGLRVLFYDFMCNFSSIQCRMKLKSQ